MIDEPNQEERPPFFSSWKKVYYFVFINLIFLIFVFYLFTKYFS
jgi:hypothetical protein